MKLNLTYQKRKIDLNCNILEDPLAQAIGLMFKSYKKAKITCFKFQNERKISITTLFCFFPILELFVKNKEIVGFKLAKAWIFNIDNDVLANNLVEIPLTKQEFVKLAKFSDLSSMVKRLSEIKKVKNPSETKALNISSA